MKKTLGIIGLCLLVGYLLFAAFFFQEKAGEELCTHFEIVSGNDSTKHMIETKLLEKEVNAKGLNPYGKRMKDINTLAIEEVLLSNKQIKSAEVFLAGTGIVKAVITVRNPILRVIPNVGEGYYVDTESQIMPLSQNLTVYLPIVTGEVTKEYAQKEIFEFVQYLRGNDFWNAQIEQINVLPNKELELIPRVGEHRILLGSPIGYKEKLDRLFVFYQKGLNEAGWNRYSTLNLKYEGQVVGTRKEEKEKLPPIVQEPQPKSDTKPNGAKTKPAANAAKAKPTTGTNDKKKEPAKPKKEIKKSSSEAKGKNKT